MINIIWACFRTGWILKAAHTIFDYVGPSQHSNQQVAKVMSDWKIVNLYGEIGGGRPPSLNRIIRDHNQGSKLHNFVHILFTDFEKVVDMALPSTMEEFRMQAAAGLSGLDQFLAMLHSHSQDIFGSPTDELGKQFATRTSVIHPFPTIAVTSSMLSYHDP
jgi:hypothetical protein